MTNNKYSASLMNNTKWREVLLLTSHFYPTFEVAYTEREKFQSARSPEPKMLKTTYIDDPGIAGGPAEYKDIYAVRFPIFHNIRNPITGVTTKNKSIYEEFILALKSLGSIPITEIDEYIYIFGYQR
ncbi:hypothetical protein [Thiothrix unzii]|uniref:Uncharacterized protein n=1 Tax=Thiothrix unzii TaxID=111769 RepID=A0A975F6D8_9GAMM|nr:hypothetical protein [Thiothrix unzii]QTR52211.1 hypothetical protein J9260_10705 [Thiothrix unzii]